MIFKGLRGVPQSRGKNRLCNLLSFNDLEKSDVIFW